MESGLFIFHISNCLLCLFVCYIKVPGFSWRPTFRCLSLVERRRAEGRRGSLHGTKTLMFAAYVTSSTSLIFTLNKHNLHIIHHPSAIHEMYSRWSEVREVDICVQTAGTSSRVCCTAVSRRWRCSEGHCEHSWNIQTFCQTKHLVKLWQ